MTDYSLWEVIKNGNKVLKKTIRDVEQVYEPTSAEEKLDRKNEMKARGTLLMALLNNDQLKFHSYKDAKLLMEAIERGMEETMNLRKLQKLISQLEIQGEVISQEDMNLKLLRSLPSEWKTHALDHQVQVKIHKMWLLCPPTALTAMAAQMKKLDVNGQRVRFHRTKVECYNGHKNGHFAREYRAPRNQENKRKKNSRRTVPVETPTKNALVAQDGIGGYDWSYQAEEEHLTNFALMAHTSSGSSSTSTKRLNGGYSCCEKEKTMEKLNTTTIQSSLSALENMHYSQMIRFNNAEEARKLQSKIDKLKQSSSEF
ncbi:hypothetical protein Tco_1020875 [Tanacetum coccineum]